MGPQRQKRDGVPAAIGLKPDNYWSSGAGPWSLFPVRIGTPSKLVHLLPSTSHHAYWTVSPGVCPDPPATCGAAEGSRFDFLNSTTVKKGVTLQDLPLTAEAPLGYHGSGDYAYDQVSFLGVEGSGGPAVPVQGVTSFYDKNLFPGLLGLTNLTTRALGTNVPGAITALWSNKNIPSLTYGYTAGSYNRNAQGSMTFGGYDLNRILDPSQNVSFPLGDDENRFLNATLSSIEVGGTTITSGPLNLLVDSTVQELWLPQNVCSALVKQYGLEWIEALDVYTNPAPALRANQSMTFTFGRVNDSPINITMPFTSLDLWDATSGKNLTVFPLKTAANYTQFTLGRAFLQDAFLITDYERRTFQLTQAKDENPNFTNLITIQPPAGSFTPSPSGLNATSATPTSTPSSTAAPDSSGLSGGAIAGIVIGSIVGALIILGLGLYFFWWRRRQSKSAAIASNDAPAARKESDHSDQVLVEADGTKEPIESPGSTPASELPTKLNVSQLPDNTRPIHEMFQLPVEMEGDSVPLHLKKPVS